MRSCRGSQRWPFYSCSTFEIYQKGEKEKWVPHELTKKKKKEKKITVKWHLLFYAAIVNHFLIGLWCVVKSRFYMTTSDEQLSGWTKKKLQSTFQSQTCTHTKKKKKKQQLVTVWWSAAHLTHCSFLNSGNTITSKKYAQEIWDASKTSTPAAYSGQQKGAKSSPTTSPTHSTTNASEVEWSMKLCLIHHIHLTSCLQTTMSSSILTTFCRENAFTINRMQKMLS